MTCSFHVKLSDKRTPNSLWQEAFYIRELPISREAGGTFLDSKLTNMKEGTLGQIPWLASSTYLTLFVQLEAILFTKIQNRRGVSLFPWGVPPFEDTDSACHLIDFICYQNDREAAMGGGVYMYVGTMHPCKRLQDFEEIKIFSICLKIRPDHLPRGTSSPLVAAVYHSSSTSFCWAEFYADSSCTEEHWEQPS